MTNVAPIDALSTLFKAVTTAATTANAADASVLYQIADKLNSILVVENATTTLSTATGAGDYWTALAKRLGSDLLNCTTEADRTALLVTINAVVTNAVTQYTIGKAQTTPVSLPVAPALSTQANFTCIAGVKEQYGDGTFLDGLAAGFTSEWGQQQTVLYWERFLAVLLGIAYVPNTGLGTPSATVIPQSHKLFRYNNLPAFREEIPSAALLYNGIRSTIAHYFFREDFVTYQGTSTSYGAPRLYWTCFALTNTTNAAINVNITTSASSYSSYSQGGLVSMTPNVTNDVRGNTSAYTFANIAVTTSTVNQNWITSTVSIPANKTVLFFAFGSASCTNTTYYTYHGELALRKPADMLPTGIVCDTKLTTNLLNFGKYTSLCQLWTDI
jgi:hypothetical protein